MNARFLRKTIAMGISLSDVASSAQSISTLNDLWSPEFIAAVGCSVNEDEFVEIEEQAAGCRQAVSFRKL